MIRLSIIIPTRNRAGLLADCLASIERQQVDPSGVEVIVIDDGSTDETASVAASFAGGAIPIRCVTQEPAGLNAGRNHGAALATGSLLAYLDDDTIVDEGWARDVIDAFDAGADAVAGRIVLRYEAPRPAGLTDKMEISLSKLDLGEEQRTLVAPEVPHGASCAVTRAMFDRVGGFGAGLDREGSSLLSNGDVDFFLRVHERGGRIVYRPRAAVLHRVPPERLTRAWFRRRAWWQGVSDGVLEHAAGRRFAGATLAREAARTSRAAGILARNLARGRGAFAAGLWVRYCAGRMAALRRPDTARGGA